MSEEKKELKLVPFITGETVDLAVQVSDMASMVCKWVNDPKVRRYSRTVMPLSLDEVKKWFEPSSENTLQDFIIFAIWHKIDKKPIGNVALNRINWVNRSAYAFLTIGEPEYWGAGIATETTKLLLQYAFEELNLNKVIGQVIIDNVGSWKVAEKAGFVFEGISREDFYVDGKYKDVKNYSYLKKDWLDLKKKES